MRSLNSKSANILLSCLLVPIVMIFGATYYQLSMIKSANIYSEGEFIFSDLPVILKTTGDIVPQIRILPMKIYTLKVESPAKLSRLSDGVIKVILEELYWKADEEIDPSYAITVELTSKSFTVNPSHSVRFPFTEGHAEYFVFSPNTVGNRKLLLKSHVDGPKGFVRMGDVLVRIPTTLQTEIISVEVIEPPTIFRLTEKTLKGIRSISLSIGLPGLLLLVVNLFISRRKKKKDNKEKRSRIILPLLLL